MLEGVEAEEGDFGGLRMAVDREYSTLVLGSVLEDGAGRGQMIHGHLTYTPSTRKEKGFAPFCHFFVICLSCRISIASGGDAC
jgi:hypothetical protein